MKNLNILDLHRSINDKQTKITECYEKVLDICHKKIQTSAKNQQLRCFIEVPCFVFGYPIFDYNKCLEYIYNSLVKNGFLVKYYFPKHFYISWDFEEIDSSKRKNQPVKKQDMTTKATLSYKPSGKLQLNLD